jgi:hypothetical protein
VDKIFLENPHFLGDESGYIAAYDLPPVSKLWCIYGINCPTQAGYYFKTNGQAEDGIVLDQEADKFRQELSPFLVI